MAYLTLIIALASVSEPSASRDPLALEQVSYADLDIQTQIGRRRLQQRIKAAADRLCQEQNDANPVAYIDARCVRFAVEHAEADVARRGSLAADDTRRPRAVEGSR